jgi:hypothetical protein
MRDEWYGDKRDIVKWGTLVTLAGQHQAEKILQVAYRDKDREYELEIDGIKCPVPPCVVRHFRSLGNIQALTPDFPLSIEVFDREFDQDGRHAYTDEVIRVVAATPGRGPWVILLDPDTGLEPPGSRPGRKHVLGRELAAIWDAAHCGDMLALYQHASRERDWLRKKSRLFQESLGVEPKIAMGPGIASDVALLYCVKTQKGPEMAVEDKVPGMRFALVSVPNPQEGVSREQYEAICQALGIEPKPKRPEAGDGKA